jgi:hypothetical protein
MQDVVEFGWLPEDRAYRSTRITIAPLHNYEQAIGCVRAARRVIEGWFYPPLVRDPKGHTADCEGVEIHARGFSLPATHRLEVDIRSADSRLAAFILQVFAFSKGLRLLPAEWTHFYRAAVEPGKLADFICLPGREVEICERAYDLWRTLPDPTLERSLFGLHHWYLFGQSYEHEFERFSAQYTVLDGCFSLVRQLSSIGTVPHTQRPQFLCERYKIPVPTWARVAGKTCAIADLRNAFVHEALYGGEPIGFAYPKGELDGIELELTNLNARILLAILGFTGDYVQSEVGTRNVFLFEP